jgi:phosphoserine phosphatase
MHVLIFSGSKLSAGHLAEFIGFCERHNLRLAPLDRLQIHNSDKKGSNPRWLKPHHVAEIILEDTPNEDQFLALQQICHGQKIDVFSVSAFNRRKKLVLADMDATMVQQETLDEIAAHIGIGAEISAITAQAMRGEVDFKDALKARVALLKGVPEQILHEVLERINITQGADCLLACCKTLGLPSVLVSGGFTFFTQSVAERLGFTHHHGNRLIIENGLLTGHVSEPILDKDSKLQFLEFYAEKYGLTPEDVCAIGDGANDLPMLKGSGLGVGFYAKPLVCQQIRNVIHFGDLTNLLYIQGFTWDQIQTLEATSLSSSHPPLHTLH